jgi:MFS family permease
MTDYLRRLNRFRRDIWLFLVTPALIGFTIFGGIYTVLFNLFLARLGYDPPFIGAVNASSQLAIAAFALPASWVGNRLGARRAMILGMSLVTLGHILPILAEFVPIYWRAFWILSTYLVGGAGMTLYFVNSSPWVMEVTEAGERNHLFSVQAALWPLAGFLGSLLGGVSPGFFAWLFDASLDSPLPYRYPLLLAASLLVIGVMALIVTREQPALAPAPQRVIDGPAPLLIILVITLVGILRGAGEGAARTFFNLYMDSFLHVSPVTIGAFLAAGQLLSAPAALLTPLLAAAWGNQRSIWTGTLGVAIMLVPFALIPQWAVAGGSFMAMLVLVSVARPAYMVYSQEVIPPGWRGLMSAFTTMSIGISWAMMAFAGGYLIAWVGYRALFLGGACLTGAGALLFWSYFGRGRKTLAVAHS